MSSSVQRTVTPNLSTTVAITPTNHILASAFDSPPGLTEKAEPGEFHCDEILDNFRLLTRITVEDEKATSKLHTGTKPFRAYDLFNRRWTGGHIYCHDLESFFYVLLCLCSRYKGPGEQVDVSNKPLPYDSWFTATYEQVRLTKMDLLTEPRFEPEVTDFFRHFESWLARMHDQL
ncbi:hypothetical protein E1B28_002809 [Marasmius oreades]|uniref:Fungal-type protein kinase domain-containing protein n=1 Tax=Marasmius oreades TaxID=181124 RepID=A0A9P7RNM1_9AGAR|nr:uncharacterized protein E1B28_002809 [Marasmius oreades]KAG7086889.1 hypothetical protein E1B28_002809 [Marasmius oreades]